LDGGMPSHPISPAGRWFVLLSFLFCAGCATPDFDQAAYANATSLKVDTIHLIGQAHDSYSSHRQDVSDLTLKLEKAYEYDKGRPLNQRTLQLWDQLLTKKADDPDSGIYPRFIDLWEKQGTISAALIPGKQQRVALAFDEIIALESGKKK
jgi:hypothetical protein